MNNNKLLWYHHDMNTQTLIGQTAVYKVTPNPKSQDVITFDVVIVASRSNFGRTDLRIKPAQGTGEVWICSDSLTINQKTS